MWLALLSPALASQQDLPYEALLERATLVVTGEVTTVEPRWAEGPDGHIETTMWLAVDGVEKGEAGDTVEVLIAGGALGEHRTIAWDAPKLVEDARYRLLLVQHEGRWRVLGGERGATLLSQLPLAFQLSGIDWSWQARPVEDGFVLNTGSFPLPAPDVGAAWTLALDVWNIESGAPLYLPNDGVTTNGTYGGGDNGLNVTLWADRDWGTALAVAATNAVGDDIVDCDIRIYGANFNGSIDWSTDPDGADPGRYDLTHTMIHELGHCLGLAHSEVAEAILYPYNTDGTGWERRHLHADDLAGIEAMYGTAELELVVAIDVGSELVVTVDNPSDAPAVDVVVQVEGETVELGDLPPLASAEATFPVPVREDCADVLVEALVEDAGQRRFTSSAALDLDCPDPTVPPPVDAPVAEAPAGCGCRSTGPGASWLWLLTAYCSSRTARRARARSARSDRASSATWA